MPLMHDQELLEVELEGAGQEFPILPHICHGIPFPAAKIKSGKPRFADPAAPGAKGVQQEIMPGKG